MESGLTFDHSNDFVMTHSLIQKYNVPGPRYTSYPTVPYWNELDFSYEIWLATLKKSFIKVGKKRVSKIMKKLNLNGIGKPKFKITTKIDKQALHCPNLISGDFTSYKPNEIWTSDITYIPTKEGWIYLCIILDTFSRAIIGWSMQDNLKRELVLNSLNMAYKKRFYFPKGIIFHSDKGSQYSSKEVRKYLKLNYGVRLISPQVNSTSQLHL